MRPLVTFVTGVLALAAGCASAEGGKAKLLITWDGEGTVYQVTTKQKLFLGAFEGVLYVETEGGTFDEAFVRCPAALGMVQDSSAVSGQGNCAIHVDVGDAIYAEWSCEGKVGACQGQFSILEGTGKFQGMTGSGPMSIRSPLRALAGSMPSGSTVRVHSGIMQIPALDYQIPGQ